MTDHFPHPIGCPSPDPKPFRILSLDGGGMRGYYTAQLLGKLLRHFEQLRSEGPLDLGKGFDLITGTSTGAILGCALGAGKHPEEVAKLYRESGHQIFPDKFPSAEISLGFAAWAWKHFDHPTASKQALESRMISVLGDETMAGLWERRRIAITIPAVSIQSYGPKVFKTPHLSELTHDRQVKLRDACLASAAAPLFFPLHPIGAKDGYNLREDLFVDGGLWANNPSLVGLLEAIAILADRKETRPIHVFSFGTCSGTVDKGHMIAHPEGGLRTWRMGKDVMELALTTSASSMTFMTKLLAATLSKLGFTVTFARIPDPEMTSQQQASIGLDRADNCAIKTMDQLAATNETRILSDIRAGKDAETRLRDLFLSLPTT